MTEEEKQLQKNAILFMERSVHNLRMRRIALENKQRARHGYLNIKNPRRVKDEIMKNFHLKDYLVFRDLKK